MVLVGLNKYGHADFLYSIIDCDYTTGKSRRHRIMLSRSYLIVNLGCGLPNNTVIPSNFDCEDGEVVAELDEQYAEMITLCSEQNGSQTLYLGCAKLVPETAANKAALYCRMVSVVFYILTAVIYLLLPEMRDLFGKCIASYCVSIGVGLCLFCAVNLTTFTEWHFIHGHCAAIGFLTLFFTVACLLWSTSIAYILLRTVNGRLSHISDRSSRPFLCYSVYSWGLSAIYVMILAIVQYSPGDHNKPNIGLTLRDTCWLRDEQLWNYFYSILCVVLVINCLIFGKLSYIIWKSPRCKPSVTKSFKYKFKMILFAFLSMGLPWMFEIISSLTKTQLSGAIILDIINTLQGIVVFLVLVLYRKRCLKALSGKIKICCCHNKIDQHVAYDEENLTRTELPSENQVNLRLISVQEGQEI